ncbi:Phosphate transport system permease protein PstC [Methylophaga frappieri]|uniref:Phosphate transport system permease protein PstC n=1 Tax=Methylophaga frappieri (strain ATCC BAA-2434 / DSM 25690 / JAM7) TaxID=754477 RepID=I1YJ62_METFJ|nr:ABC transporter permease subunit [Methylophaga frappieri]AFJ02955.1 Phosphate transport system permease protein PstC [Methylophaga frappieri]
MSDSILPAPDSSVARRRRHYRQLKDRLAKWMVTSGGLMVIVAIVLIFFYLLYVVIPLFGGADVRSEQQFTQPADNYSHLTLDEYNEVALSLTMNGELRFFDAHSGALLQSPELPLPENATIVSFAAGSQHTGVFSYGFSDGQALLFQEAFNISYPEGTTRLISPEIRYPLGDTPVSVDPAGQALSILTAQYADDMATFAALTADGRLVLTRVKKAVNFLDETQFDLDTEQWMLATDSSAPVADLKMDVDQRELYVIYENGDIAFFDIQRQEQSRLVDRVNAVPEGVKVTATEFLAGGISLIVGRSDGQIDQWFPVRDDDNQYSLKRIRSFHEQQAAIHKIEVEQSRKGFMALDADGRLGVYHTTAHRTLLVMDALDNADAVIAISPRANGLLSLDRSGSARFFEVDNEHPEISWHSLWEKVWYESRSEPEYLWQSTSASNDFEPKLSLTPLTFGTLKAAFYAMVVAIPLAIMGAIYTAYFMSSRMRGVVKPTIEIMEALPTVILGFLAGLWLAPLIENNLPGALSIVLFMPLVMLLVAWLWTRLPKRFRHAIPAGWEAAILIPFILLTGYVCLQMSVPVEQFLFAGDMPRWLESVGIGYDQRNSFVVGLMMGFAVIPTIFSITEDAIFNVPKQLTIGSLALGATPWQTMMRVVLLTASPGIFSAVMIGLGRAVGETMIVLMATGNTPIMDFNIFEGFRALSANIAVEMPESEVGSTHFRVLFLAALVLFVATFIFNTLAELVRQRLRKKYSSL